MSIIKDRLAYYLSWILFIFLAIQTAQAISGLNDIPPPPPRPQRFHSREELKRYLQLVHEYYAIIGRPRFGRSLQKTMTDTSDVNLVDSVNLNGDKAVSYDELQNQLAE